MQSFSNSLNAASPIELLRQGETWLELWKHSKDRDQALLPAIYCLLSALELYLKAYVVLKDNSFSDTDKLRKELGHNFNSLFAQINRLADSKFAQHVKTQCEKYKLFDNLRMDTLKYPESGRMWSMNNDLVAGNHSLGPIFEKIQSEVNDGQEVWLQKRWPKHIQKGLVFQIDYEGEPTKITSTEEQTLLNSCPKCLPIGVIVNEHYSFPWHVKSIPARACGICHNWFMPDGSRHKAQSEQ